MPQAILARIGLIAVGFVGIGSCRGGAVTTETPTTSIPTVEAQATTSVVRIMPLGDSITQSDSDHDSYRRALWKLMESSGHAVDFVGSETENHRGAPPRLDFDRDHEGHWGWRVDEILERLPEWLETHRPDILLVHLGSNDVFQRQTNDSTLNELAKLVAIVRAHGADAVVLLAQVIPTTTGSANARILDLNTRLPELAEPDSVLIVDHHTGFDAAGMTFDGVHPNADGETHMAERWFSALREVLP